MPGVIGNGKTALVTGCSSGLGLALVHLLLDRGVTVWGLSRRPPPIEPSPHFHWHPCDLAEADALLPILRQVAGEAGTIDLVVNNAGSASVGTLAEYSSAEIESSLRLLLMVPVLTTRFFLDPAEHQMKRAPAVIVNTSSLAAGLPIPLMSPYNAAKAGLSGFTLSLVLDRRSYPNTRFIDFCPGDYRTAFADAFKSGDGKGPSQTRQAYLQRLADHHTRAPEAERAAADLCRAIETGREGTVRSGSLFQAGVTPWGIRFLPARWLQAIIHYYYGRPT
jgi:NAD(P)-dependent dehydrogenase (short-subunit alcohol dehydrogenase family)